MDGFAGELIRARSERGMSQAELAEATGYTRQSIGAFENGTRTPKVDFLKNACLALGWSSDDMLGLPEEVAKREQRDQLIGSTHLSRAAIQQLERNGIIIPALDALLQTSDFRRLVALIGLLSHQFSGVQPNDAVRHRSEMKYVCHQLLDDLISDAARDSRNHADNTTRQRIAQAVEQQRKNERASIDMIMLELLDYYAGDIEE